MCIRFWAWSDPLLQFASVEVVITTLEDQFGLTVHRYLKRKEVTVLAVCSVAYMLGLPNITNVCLLDSSQVLLWWACVYVLLTYKFMFLWICFQGGIYFFKLIDSYSSGISLMLIALFEVIAIAWGYGQLRPWFLEIQGDIWMVFVINGVYYTVHCIWCIALRFDILAQIYCKIHKWSQ